MKDDWGGLDGGGDGGGEVAVVEDSGARRTPDDARRIPCAFGGHSPSDTAEECFTTGGALNPGIISIITYVVFFGQGFWYVKVHC